jgi:hypothetical protein
MTRIFELDEFSDAVWWACTGDSSVLEIIAEMVNKYPEADPMSVAGLTLYNLRFFEKERLIMEVGCAEALSV